MNSVGPILTLAQMLDFLSPELTLLAAGMLILGVDAFLPQRGERKWLLPAALAGLAVALAATLSLWGSGVVVFGSFSCDALALAVKVVAFSALGLVALVSDAYMRAHTRRRAEFYALLLFTAIPISLLGGATNLIMLFLAFDFLSIASYILTGYLRDDIRSTEAAVKYFLYGAVISAAMLYGMSWLYGLTGTVTLAGIAQALMDGESALRPVVVPALIFVLAGFAFKIGAVPFHHWAPDAYEGAPTPVTAFLSVCPKIAGFAVILRVIFTAIPAELKALTADWQTLLIAISVLTMTFGNLVAIWQHNVKRLLAYSSIAQAGYILVGVVAASALGAGAVLFYLAAYAVSNLGAFAAVIAFSNQTGSDEIEDYAGLHKRAPGVAMILLICLLSLAGVPPTAGFFGKLWLFSAAIEKGLAWLAFVGVINSVISVSYYWKLIRAMYFDPMKTEEPVAVTPALNVALGVAVLGVFVVGVFSGPIMAALEPAARLLFPG